MPAQPSSTRPPWARDLALLTLMFGLLYFFQLGDTPLLNPDESRYGEIPREMIATGDYVLPRLNGVFYFEKPPLMYWLVAGSMRAFGSSELAIRAVPALFALGGVLLAYAAGRRLYDRRTGLGAALVLGTSLLFFAFARILLLDMAVSVLMSATLFCFILGVRETPGWRRRWFFYGLYASAALATLTKGLIGFLVTGAVMFFWLLLFNQWRRLRPFYLPSGALLFLAIAAPWHFLAAQRNDAWAQFYFVHEHWERFTTTAHGRYEPWWFFIPVLLAGLFPWMGFLWSAVRDALAGGWARRKENADAWFLVTWAAFVFLFFSKSQSKLIPYILPVFPPLAVLIGAWLTKVIAADDRPRLRVGAWVFSAFAGVLGSGLIYAVFVPGIIKNPAQMMAVRTPGLVCGATLILGAFAVHWLLKHRRAITALVALGGSALTLLLTLALVQNDIARADTRALAAIVTARAQPGDRIYHYHEFFHDFVFYAQREVGTVDYASELGLGIDPAARASGRFINDAEFLRQWSGSTRLWAVARKGDVKALFTDPSFRYYLLGEGRNHYLFSNQP